MKGAALRYLPWLARDVARSAGLLYLVVLIVAGVFIWRMRDSGMLPEAAVLQAQTFGAMLVVAVLIATGGMVATDRQQGFYRIWFSKPMAPWWYYLQRFVLGWIVLILTPLLYGAFLAVALKAGTGVTWALLGNISLGYLLIGSAVFLASTLLRWDWLLVFLLSFAQSGLHGFRNFSGGLPKSLDLIYQVLPPFHLVNPANPLPTGTELLHAAGYGLAMLVLALLVLTFRPLGSGGRA